MNISGTFQNSPQISQKWPKQLYLHNMSKKEKSSTKKPQNMWFLQKIPLKKSFKIIFDFYI